MKASLKLLIAGISTVSLGLSAALPSRAQGTPEIPNAQTTPSMTPAPTNRPTGVPPIGGAAEGQFTPSQTAPNQMNPSQTTPSSGDSTTPQIVPNNPSQREGVPPAQQGIVNNAPNFSSTGSEGRTLTQVVRTNPNFELFNALLQVANSNSNGAFSAQLAGGDYTVFAPTDEALAAIPPATFKALVQPENSALLAQVLEAHIVRGRVTSSELAAKPVRAMSGNELMTQGGMIGNARVVGADIMVSNGIIHAIDQVILPADLQARVVGLAPQATLPVSQPMMPMR